MTQNITFPNPGTHKLGVNEPIVLKAIADTGRRLVYTIESGTGTLSGVQLTPSATGSMTIRATATAFDIYDESFEEITFDVVDGNFFERSSEVARIRARLDADTTQLRNLAMVGLADIQSLEFKLLANSAEVVVNKVSYNISYKRFAEVFIQSSIKAWEDLIVAEETRLAALITEVKAKPVV